MATYDMTVKTTAGVGSNKLATSNRGDYALAKVVQLEAYLDIAKMVADGYSNANGDIFQLLDVPAGFLILNAGAEVMTAFDGTSPTVDIDFAAGDDIVDGGDVSTTGYLASGTNGQTNVIRGTAASTYTEFNATADTVDVLLNAASADVTTGVLRVYVQGIDCSAYGDSVPTEVTRDQLA